MPFEEEEKTNKIKNHKMLTTKHSHPIHPATVHFPIAFLTTSYALDLLHLVRPYLPISLLSTHLPTTTESSRIAYWTLTLGLLTSLPSAASGFAQAAKMVSSQGLYDSATGKLKQKSKVLIAHAAINDLVIAVSGYVWWQKRATAASMVDFVKQGVNNPLTTVMYEPQTWMVGASVVLGVLLVFAANLGGSLVYDYGLGLSLAKKAIKKN
jgi:uncharacterized membrane protein